MINSRVIQNLEAFGDRYCDRYFARWRDIRDNWWTAFEFFYDHAFMRGRRDQLSAEYYQFTINILKGYFGIPDKPGEEDFKKATKRHEDFAKDLEDILRFKRESGAKLSANSIKTQRFVDEIVQTHPLTKKLVVAEAPVKGQRPLNNDKDLMMVLSALAFLTAQGMPANVHNYILNQLRIGGAAELSTALKEIRFVGDKLASFILRDVILMNPELAIDNVSLVFPVDVWVSKIAKRFGCESEDHDEIRSFFIKQMPVMSVAKIAAGLWYLGFHSLEIVLANLDRIEMI